MRVRLAVAVCALLITLTQSMATADIFRWDNGRLIAGTEGITPLPGIQLDFRQLGFANLADRNLQGASFRYAQLSGADFSQSRLGGSNFFLANLAQAKFVGTDLGFSVMDFANLSGANLTNTQLTGTSLLRSQLTDANLAGAQFIGSNLTDANLSGAIVAGAAFLESRGFTPAQLYSTGSYHDRKLAGIRLDHAANLVLAGQDLTGAQFVGDLENVDFSGANLVNATFSPDATWHDVNFSGADLRGAEGVKGAGPNTILSMGEVEGLSLLANDVLVVRDYDGDPARRFEAVPISVRQGMHMESGGRLRLEFDKDAWDSLITFSPGIPVELGGTLDLDFGHGINTTPLRGRTIRVFDWTGVEPHGRFEIQSPFLWDLSSLYSTGEIRLTGAGLAGDYNGNHVVDQIDLDLVLRHWGSQSTVPPVRWVNDFPSGLIDQQELDKVLANWGRTNLQAGSVPEPTSFTLFCMALAGLMGVRIHAGGRHARRA